MEKSFLNTFDKDVQLVNNSYEDFEEELKSYQTNNEIEKRIKELRKDMENVAKKLDFLAAADLRDKIELLKKKLK